MKDNRKLTRRFAGILGAALVFFLGLASPRATLMLQSPDQVKSDSGNPLTSFYQENPDLFQAGQQALFNLGKGKKTGKTRIHRVKRGDTLSEIAVKYGTTVSKLRRLNRIGRRDPILIGQKLEIPGRNGDSQVSSYPRAKLTWPLKRPRRLSKKFRRGGGQPHLGIVLRGREPGKVYAASGGKVVRVHQMRGYGRYVIIQHKNHLLTVYAGLSKIYVKPGQKIPTRGLLGRIDRKSKYNLQFQVGHYGRPVNPLAYLRS